MELTREHLRKLNEELSEETTLQEILATKYPKATISIIRGYDTFAHEAYTNAAFFHRRKAEKMMAIIPPHGDASLTDTYHIVTGTIRELNDGKIFDKRTGRVLDEIDRKMVYTFLARDLSK